MNILLFSNQPIALAANKVRNRIDAHVMIPILCAVDSHMEMVAKMMSEEEDSKVVHTYNIGNTFRGYHAKMSTRYSIKFPCSFVVIH